MLILGQKPYFLGPTIFKIPQPNWYYAWIPRLFKDFCLEYFVGMYFGNAYHFYISVAEHEARQIRNNITAVASGNAFSHIASFMPLLITTAIFK